jgi:hypothetical protein
LANDISRTASHELAANTGSFLKETQLMFVNLSSESRQQLLALVQTMRLSETDVVAFALQQLFDERNSNHARRVKKTQNKAKESP